MATPALHALRQAYPRAHVAALTMLPGSREILANNPDLDELLAFNFSKEGLWRSIRYMNTIRKRGFDAVIATYPSNRLEYNTLLWLTRAPLRSGHRYRNLDLPCGNFLKNVSVIENDSLTNIQENLRLVNALGVTDIAYAPPKIWLTNDEHTAAQLWLTQRGLEGKSLVGFHAGCDTKKNHIRRRWPVERFVELGRAITSEEGTVLLVFGGPDEEQLKQEIVRGISRQAISVSTKNLLQSCALIARCSHFVSNDSGLMHAAGALGVSTTAIFGPTNPTWARNAWARRTEVSRGLACQPCFYYSPRHLRCRYGDFRCIAEISVGDVLGNMCRCEK